MTSEEFHDAEIAPALLDLAKKCEAHGLSFLAVTESKPGEHIRTVTLQHGAGLGIVLANVAAQANGNADSLIMAIMQYARKHGHSSVYLQKLGIPLKPGGTD